MHLVYQTENCEIFQSDEDNCFYLDLKGNQYPLKPCGLIALKSKIDRINIEKMLLSDERSSDVEIIYLCNKERLLVLTLDEVLELKDLLSGVTVMLELNTILRHIVYSPLV